MTELKSVYDRVKPFLPASKEAEPLSDVDHDGKKLEIFLTLHSKNLQVLGRFSFSKTLANKFVQVQHLKIFTPFTIHLDPHLCKVIKEERSNLIAIHSGEVYPLKENLSSVYPLVATTFHSSIEAMSIKIPNAIRQCFKPSLPPLLLTKWLSQLSPEEVVELVRHLDGLRSSQVASISYYT